MKRTRVRQVGAVAWMLVFGIVGCSNPAVAGTSALTCDDYAQRSVLPDNIGDDTQSSAILDLFEQRGLSWNVRLVNKVQSQVDQFCGKPSPTGDSKAKRNNSSPIDEAVDWDHLPQR